jgi:hypothetical protein
MIVYFSATSRNIKEDIDTYRKIIETVHKLEHTVTHSWVEAAWHRAERDGKSFGDIEGVVKDTLMGIESAEIVIAEASDVSTFGVGFEVARALYRRKPVLVLVKPQSLANSYVTGIHDDLLTLKKYDKHNISKIIEDFIKEHTVKTKDLRFNFVIDRQIYNYLRLKSFRSQKTKGEVVRELLIKDMEKD